MYRKCNYLFFHPLPTIQDKPKKQQQIAKANGKQNFRQLIK